METGIWEHVCVCVLCTYAYDPTTVHIYIPVKMYLFPLSHWIHFTSVWSRGRSYLPREVVRVCVRRCVATWHDWLNRRYKYLPVGIDKMFVVFVRVFIYFLETLSTFLKQLSNSADGFEPCSGVTPNPGGLRQFPQLASEQCCSFVATAQTWANKRTRRRSFIRNTMPRR